MSGKTATRAVLLLCVCLMVLCGPIAVQAQTVPPNDPLNKVGFDQKIDQQVPLDLTFRDELGRPVTLADYVGAKPAILVLAYYKCPNLCTLVLTKLVETMRGMSFDAGNQFEVVTLSIDPRDTPAIASAKKATYLERYQRAGATEGWHFLTGEQAQIDQLTETIGFRYAYDARQDQYAHPTGIMVLTPEGKIPRYFYDLEYTPRDLRLGLVEASDNKVGSPIDYVLLRCYHYDPITGQYTVAIMNIVRMIGVATTIFLGMFVLVMYRRDRRVRVKIEDRR